MTKMMRLLPAVAAVVFSVAAQASTISETLTGTITLPSALSIDVVNPGMTATLAGTIVNGTQAGQPIDIDKFGLGTLVLNQSFVGTVTSSSGALSFLTDGVAYVGTSDPEIVTVTAAVDLTGPTTINIGRLGTTLLPEFTSASNKTVSLPNLVLNGYALTVNNLNGYGLLVPSTDAVSLGIPSNNSGFSAAGHSGYAVPVGAICCRTREYRKMRAEPPRRVRPASNPRVWRAAAYRRRCP